MRESVWLKKHVEEVQGKRDQSAQKKKVMLILLPMMFGLFFIAIIASAGEAMASEIRTAMIVMLAVFAGVMVMVILLLGKAKKIDATKGTRENVTAILKTDEDVEFFDMEMSQKPLKEVWLSGVSKFFVTQNYIGVKFMYLGDEQYRFAKKTEVTGFAYCKTKGVKEIFFDVLNYNNEKIFGESATSMNQINEIIYLVTHLLFSTNIYYAPSLFQSRWSSLCGTCEII